MTKTLAFRMSDEDHTQATVAAQLVGENLTDFIRAAVSDRVESVKADPSTSAKAIELARKLDAENARTISSLAEFTAMPTQVAPPS